MKSVKLLRMTKNDSFIWVTNCHDYKQNVINVKRMKLFYCIHCTYTNKEWLIDLWVAFECPLEESFRVSHAFRTLPSLNYMNQFPSFLCRNVYCCVMCTPWTPHLRLGSQKGRTARVLQINTKTFLKIRFFVKLGMYLFCYNLLISNHYCIVKTYFSIPS